MEHHTYIAFHMVFGALISGAILYTTMGMMRRCRYRLLPAKPAMLPRMVKRTEPDPAPNAGGEAVSMPARMHLADKNVSVTLRNVGVNIATIACSDPQPLNAEFALTALLATGESATLDARVIWTNRELPEDRVVSRGMRIRLICREPDRAGWRQALQPRGGAPAGKAARQPLHARMDDGAVPLQSGQRITAVPPIQPAFFRPEGPPTPAVYHAFP